MKDEFCLFRSCLFLLVLCLHFSTVCADDMPEAQVTSNDQQKKQMAESARIFEQKVRPLLVAKCQECHGEEKQKGQLRVDSIAGILEGGDSGPLLTPGDVTDSLLLNVVSYRGEIKMPPKSKLSDTEIADLTLWIKSGAVWPDSTSQVETRKNNQVFEISAEQRSFWAFQPISNITAPEVKHADWIQSPVDRFILRELEFNNLQPAPAASRRTLLRRLTFDLTGLPPTETEIRNYLADDTPDALPRVVDRLLASPRYGEHWARHWLDVARYADSNGLDENLAYANAFRYRDYVIKALNSDLPFDQFLQEQIAGDLLPDSGDIQRQHERTTATGFLCLGAKMLAEDDPVKMQMDIIDEQVDTIGRTFLGLTIGCARCHDHKYDPLSQADYYGLAGIFKSTKTMENFSVVARWQELPLATPTLIQARSEHIAKIDTKKREVEQVLGAARERFLDEARRNFSRYLIAATRERQLTSLMESKVQSDVHRTATEIPDAFLLEAESFVRGNVQNDQAGYGKGIGVIVNRGEKPNFVEYDLTIPKDRQYLVEMRYAAAESRPCVLSLNGQLLTSDAAGKVTGSWQPDGQKWFNEGIFHFPAGKVTLRLEHPVFFPHIDQIQLVPIDETLRVVEIPVGEHALNSSIVQGFIKALNESVSSSSIWRTWHHFVKYGNLDGVEGNGQFNADDPLASRLRGSVPPVSLVELAQRYHHEFETAVEKHKTLRNTPGGQSALKLEDPQAESFRQLAFSMNGPFVAPKNIEASLNADVRQQLTTLRDETQKLEKGVPQLPEAMAVSESKPENLKIHLRGSHTTLGAETPRRFPVILTNNSSQRLGAESSGRLELARWMTGPDNPLTSRVFVNRIWLWHFGEGLVRSPDNFGKLGDRPTHPELLDWLARRFMEHGWSIKQLHREIVLSSTYQMSTQYNSAAMQVDPENRLYWRWNRRRLTAEELRDGMLAVSGALDATMGGSQLTTGNRQYVTSTANVNPVVYQSPRRSIYLPVVRSALFDVFQAFDFADPSVLNGRRDQTTVAPQALFMMNSQFSMDQSHRLAKEMLGRTDWDTAARIQSLYEKAYSRPASPQEIQRGLSYLERFRSAVQKSKAPSSADQNSSPAVTSDEIELQAWRSLTRGILSANEFIYLE